MNDTPREPVCLHCGTPRPADVPTCPNCGHGWVDERISDDSKTDGAAAVAGAGTGATAAAAAKEGGEGAPPFDDTGEFTFDDWTLPPERPRSKAIWLIPIMLLVAVAIVWGLVFLDSDPAPTTTIAALTTTTASATTTEATTTTSASTTSTAPTTTLAPFPPPNAWPPDGDPIAIADLPLKAAGIGDFDFGTSVADVASRFSATFGEAESAGEGGRCDQEAYWLQWGDLMAIFDGFEPDATFIAYRNEDLGSDIALGLTTLSGLAVGDTVGDLKQIYSTFTITFEVIDGQDHFRLVDGAELLLWGPVSGTTDDDLVEGIYSPTPCDG